ncbi:MAG: amidohydrolase family protein, partial [Candidatus Caldarchaeum sp.]
MGRLNQLGSLEPGKKADIVVVSLRRPSVSPLSNPLSLLVYAASGADVRDVMVNGRFVVRDWRPLTLDEEEIIKNSNKHVERVLAKAGLSTDIIATT